MGCTSLNKDDLCNYICHQINSIFPDKHQVAPIELKKYIKDTLERTINCLGKIRRSAFHKNGEPYFNHLHSNAYSMFLYLLSNTAFEVENSATQTVEKIFYLNKVLNGVDILWDTPLKEYFYFSRPLGTTIGNLATYGNYFVIFQGCTVGGSSLGYPTIGDGVILYTNCSLLGKCKVGNYVQLSAHSSVFNMDIPDSTTVFGFSTKNQFKTTRNTTLHEFFYL